MQAYLLPVFHFCCSHPGQRICLKVLKSFSSIFARFSGIFAHFFISIMAYSINEKGCQISTAFHQPYLPRS